MRTISIFIGIIIIGSIIAFFLMQSSDTQPTDTPEVQEETQTENMEADTTSETATDSSQDSVPDEAREPQLISVEYTDDGFSPKTITALVGDIVVWTNVSSNTMWPASANHPTHTVYPGSNIDKCGTEAASTIFDACEPVAVGGQYSFEFTEAGEWKYHNHLRPNETGAIIVEEVSGNE